MTTLPNDAASATHLTNIPVFAFGLSLSVFSAITFSLCVLFGLLISAQGMHELFATIFPGFVWLTVPGLLIGLGESFFCWSAAILFASLFNYVASQRR